MQCIRPIKAGFDHAGNITYSSTQATKELAPFAFPCRKCLPCRLNIGREKAVRAMHEAQMHEENIFLTLTYSQENLRSPKLIYPEFQQFMKSLLEYKNRNITCPENRHKIPFMVTGEYGELTKRPHWHVILFNYSPTDSRHLRTTDNGERVYDSEELRSLWKKGNLEYGSVTMDSASYVARYAAKKLVHGKDQEHDFHPIHKTSSKHAIGKAWIEKYHKQTFNHGYVTLPNGEKTAIPRYYEDWYRKNHPDQWMEYAANIKTKTKELAEANARKEELENLSNILSYAGSTTYPLMRKQVKERILQSKFKQLQGHLKL